MSLSSLSVRSHPPFHSQRSGLYTRGRYSALETSVFIAHSRDGPLHIRLDLRSMYPLDDYEIHHSLIERLRFRRERRHGRSGGGRVTDYFLQGEMGTSASYLGYGSVARAHVLNGSFLIEEVSSIHGTERSVWLYLAIFGLVLAHASLCLASKSDNLPNAMAMISSVPLYPSRDISHAA